MEFIYGIESIVVYGNGKWEFPNKAIKNKGTIVKVERVGRINFSDIVEYDIKGDEYYQYPHIFCNFKYQGLTFESTYFCALDNIGFSYEDENKIQ